MKTNLTSRKGAKTQRGGSTGCIWESVDHPLDPILDQRLSKVNEQSQAAICQPQVGKQLLCGNGRHHLNRFQLNDQRVFNDEIRTKAFLEYDSIKLNRD